jgi:hypothetical protein
VGVAAHCDVDPVGRSSRQPSSTQPFETETAPLLTDSADLRGSRPQCTDGSDALTCVGRGSRAVDSLQPILSADTKKDGDEGAIKRAHSVRTHRQPDKERKEKTVLRGVSHVYAQLRPYLREYYYAVVVFSSPLYLQRRCTKAPLRLQLDSWVYVVLRRHVNRKKKKEKSTNKEKHSARRSAQTQQQRTRVIRDPLVWCRSRHRVTVERGQ